MLPSTQNQTIDISGSAGAGYRQPSELFEANQAVVNITAFQESMQVEPESYPTLFLNPTSNAKIISGNR